MNRREHRALVSAYRDATFSGASHQQAMSVLVQAAQQAINGGPQAVQQFMQAQGFPQDGAWCGEFAAAVVRSTGGTPPSRPEVASNWRNYGTPTSTPHAGDVAIRKGTGSYGGSQVSTGSTGSHVTFVGGVDPRTGTFTGLGGNQGRNHNYPTTSARYPVSGFEFRTPPNASQANPMPTPIPGADRAQLASGTPPSSLIRQSDVNGAAQAMSEPSLAMPSSTSPPASAEFQYDLSNQNPQQSYNPEAGTDINGGFPTPAYLDANYGANEAINWSSDPADYGFASVAPPGSYDFSQYQSNTPSYLASNGSDVTSQFTQAQPSSDYMFGTGSPSDYSSSDANFAGSQSYDPSYGFDSTGYDPYGGSMLSDVGSTDQNFGGSQDYTGGEPSYVQPVDLFGTPDSSLWADNPLDYGAGANASGSAEFSTSDQQTPSGSITGGAGSVSGGGIAGGVGSLTFSVPRTLTPGFNGYGSFGVGPNFGGSTYSFGAYQVPSAVGGYDANGVYHGPGVSGTMSADSAPASLHTMGSPEVGYSADKVMDNYLAGVNRKIPNYGPVMQIGSSLVTAPQRAAATGTPSTPATNPPPEHLAHGGAIDVAQWMKRQSGKVPGVDHGVDEIHALLRPKEVVFNTGQLSGLKVGNKTKLRSDQIRAIKSAQKRKAA